MAKGEVSAAGGRPTSTWGGVGPIAQGRVARKLPLSVNGSVNLPNWGRTVRLTQCGENETKDPLKGSRGERLKNEPNGLKGELRISPVGKWAGDGEKSSVVMMRFPAPLHRGGAEGEDGWKSTPFGRLETRK